MVWGLRTCGAASTMAMANPGSLPAAEQAPLVIADAKQPKPTIAKNLLECIGSCIAANSGETLFMLGVTEDSEACTGTHQQALLMNTRNLS